MTITVQANVDLSDRNTLGVPSRADYFCVCSSVDEVREALAWSTEHHQPLRILGGGSNTLLSERISGLVIKADFSDWHRVREDEHTILLKAGAGVNWHQFVRATVTEGWSGLENLAFIPGTVGAAPIQNIGAYGVEVASCVVSVHTINMLTGQTHTFNNQACCFGYRDSLFKQPEGRHYLVYAVAFQLQKHFQPILSYPALKQAFQGHEPVSPSELADKVEAIRREKLPDPQTLPNVGSFFKNPIVPMAQAERLQHAHPEIVSYEFGQAHKKIAAAWLIDQCGWKQKSLDGVSVHAEQALVVVNPQRRALASVIRLTEAIQADVLARFGVSLEPEPQHLRAVTEG